MELTIAVKPANGQREMVIVEVPDRWTGQIRVNVHEGAVSRNVQKLESELGIKVKG